MITFSKADIQEEDIERMRGVLRSGWLVNGPVVEEIEKMFCDFTGARYAAAMNSCTAALHTSCAYLSLKMNKESMKVPEVTHIATAHAVCLTGMEVTLVDVDPVDGIILPEYVTGDEIVVHLAGQPCEEIKPTTIEDCAHALGTRFSDGSHVGTRGLCGCFSFYPTKHITSAEGGMLITNDKELYIFARHFRAFGITTPPEERKLPADYDSLFVSPNYRMPDVLAALLIGQLERFEKNRIHREKIANIYHHGLKDIVVRPSWRPGTSWFIYQIQTQKRDELVSYLKERGVQTSIHYRHPLSCMSVYKTKPTGGNAIKYTKKVLSLPVHQGVSENDAHNIVDNIKSGLAKAS